MMKKYLRIISVILCAVLALSLFTACSDPGAPDHDVSEPVYASPDLAQNISRELEDFLDNCKDRTTFTSGESAAADYLFGRLTDMGYAPTYQDFTVEENNVKDLESRNVIADYKSGGDAQSGKTVILGAYYDNRYGEAYKNAPIVKSEAALAGGSGVATLLAIADHLKSNSVELDVDVKIVFFGAAYLYVDGARAFYNSYMTFDERKNTVLMIEMQRLGVDHVYAYSDARPTERESFFDGIAMSNKLDIYKITQKSPLITSATAYKGIPYYQWAFGGVFSVFADNKIPTLNLVGANWETLDLTDAESAHNANISYTENDTLDNLLKLYPDCTQKMASAATLVIKSLEHADFAEVMSYDRDNYPDTDILTKQWVWFLVVLGVLMLTAGVMIAVYTHLDKKYKFVVPPPKRMKMAVFGMDYEDKDAADIFIDIRNTAPREDIFPGIPNNDADPPVAKTSDVKPPESTDGDSGSDDDAKTE